MTSFKIGNKISRKLASHNCWDEAWLMFLILLTPPHLVLFMELDQKYNGFQSVFLFFVFLSGSISAMVFLEVFQIQFLFFRYFTCKFCIIWVRLWSCKRDVCKTFVTKRFRWVFPCHIVFLFDLFSIHYKASHDPVGTFYWHIGPRTKWLTFCKQHFHMHFFKRKSWCFHSVFIKVCAHVSKGPIAIIGTDNSLALINQWWVHLPTHPPPPLAKLSLADIYIYIYI